MTLHDNLAQSHPRCVELIDDLTHYSYKVDPALSLRTGWPKCCGATMTIDSPAEQRALAKVQP